MSIQDLDALIEWLLREWQHAAVMNAENRHRIADARSVLISLRHAAVNNDPMYETNLDSAFSMWRDVFNGGDLDAGLTWVEGVRHVG